LSEETFATLRVTPTVHLPVTVDIFREFLGQCDQLVPV